DLKSSFWFRRFFNFGINIRRYTTERNQSAFVEPVKRSHQEVVFFEED
ncbi:8792_t:CDS:2, partial [Funneliformis mosseae]